MPINLPNSSDPLLIILKLPGEVCNINCHYCYEKRKPYHDDKYMMPETIRRLLSTLNGRPISVQLHGGEPLVLGIKRMEKVIQELSQYPGEVDLNIQTNGTLLTPEWLDFFERVWPDIEIGVSLDGDADANWHRVDYQDRPAHAKIEKSLELLTERGHKVGIIAVITRRALGRAEELLKYFTQFPCIKMLNLSPCLDYDVNHPWKNRSRQQKSLVVLNSTETGTPGWALSPLEYADFLIEAFKAWRDGPGLDHYLVEPFFSIICRLQGKSTRFCPFNERKCSHVLTLYPDGRVGSCDELRMPEAFLASVSDFDDVNFISRLQTNPELHGRMNKLKAICDTCAYQPTCQGGCLATRLAYYGTPYEEEYCAYRAKVIDFIRTEVGQSSLNAPVPVSEYSTNVR
ncbi:MAG: radical SAM protein [Candidatus Poribacteria bacterium]|nr:radical SAM protein [Candidatus Poribacteria bacterium]